MARVGKHDTTCAALVVAVVAVLAVTSGLAVDAARTVLVMRHCVRSTSNDVKGGAAGFGWADNYTAQPWPAWPDNLAPYLCLPNGVAILQGTGAWLRDNGNLPQPLTMIADNVTRDITTSHAVAMGLGFPMSSIKIDHGPFSKASTCPDLAHSVEDAAVAANLKANPAPPEYTANLARLQAVTGKGVAPALADIPNYIKHGYFEGGAEVAQGEAERILMELGGAMGSKIGWGRVAGPGQVYEMLVCHSWPRLVGVAVPEVQAYKGASITFDVAQALADSSDEGTLILVGHDDQMWSLAATLNMTWATPEFPVLPTLPGSMLRFDLSDDDMVSVSYMYPLFGNSSGDLNRVDVKFKSSNTSTCTLSELQARVAKAVNMECVNKLQL